MTLPRRRVLPRRRGLRIEIPGEPHAQQRHRSTRRGTSYDPPANRAWKRMAQVHMVRARTEQGWAIAEPREALVVLIQARYSCPRSEHRKRDPRPARWHTGRGDSDNVAKAVLDAGTGVLWVDDAQVSRLVVTKWVGAQGEPPQVVVNVRILPGRGPEDRR